MCERLHCKLNYENFHVNFFFSLAASKVNVSVFNMDMHGVTYIIPLQVVASVDASVVVAVVVVEASVVEASVVEASVVEASVVVPSVVVPSVVVPSVVVASVVVISGHTPSTDSKFKVTRI